MSEYNVPNRAVPLTIVASSPINENWQKIEDALNSNYELAKDVVNKVDNSDVGVANGVASLDINSKLLSDQVPDEAKGHVYEVNSLTEQLSLTAYSGDICVRKDINKTYCLANDTPNQFANWIEVASSNSGGDIGANPCYTNLITEGMWISYPEGGYYIEFTDLEHGQGATRYLYVSINRLDGKNINCDYSVSENGLVKIETDVAFEASIMISNLSGNVKNEKYMPYTVISGPVDVNSNPILLSRSLHSIQLNTSPTIVLVDGMDYVRNIISANETRIENVDDGTYVAFIDSANLSGSYLGEISYILKENYLGVLSSLPEEGIDGQRCYIAYGQSYEYGNSNWIPKAFVPIGEFTQEDGIISSITSYKYRENGVNVDYKTNAFDYLYGKQIEGLKLTITDNLVITPGTCFGQKRLLKLNQSLTKNINDYWQAGTNNGCIDSNSNYQITNVFEVTKDDELYYTTQEGSVDTYVIEGSTIYNDPDLTEAYGEANDQEFIYTGNSSQIEILNTGWGYIFLIGNINDVDILLSFDSQPTLPYGYDEFRRIAYFYRDEDGNITQEKQLDNKFYLKEPQVVEPIEDDASILNLSLPGEVKAILNIKANNEKSAKIYLEDFLIEDLYIKNITTIVPSNITFDSTEDLEFLLLGVEDERID